MTKNLKNIPLKTFRKFLIQSGLKKIRTSGGHEVWSGSHLKRPVVLQSHIDPIPEFIIRNNLRIIGISSEEFKKYLENN
jgi:hypothetical protein